MYIISFHILSTRISWTYEFYFETKSEAEGYLIANNYKKNGVFFEKEYSKWFPKTSATVIMLKPHKKKNND